MTLQQASEVVADEVHQAIDFTATAISKKYDLDVERVRRVLEATEYTGPITDPVLKSHNSLTRLWRSVWQQNHRSELRDSQLHVFSPSLAHALEYLPPTEALNLFESENISLLKIRESTMHYLSKSFTPFYDLKELGKLAKSLRSHLNRNRDHILETGLPKKTFKKSQLHNSLLSPLYPNKNTYLFSSDERIIYLDERHKLNSHERLTIFNLKLRILKEIIIALKNRNTQLLLEKCTDALDCMSSDEFNRFIELEKIYFRQHTPNKRKSVCNFHFTTGGIIDILKTIGYYEKELTIGTYSKTKNMLADIISNRNFTRLRKHTNNTNVSPYFLFVALGKKEKASLIRAQKENILEHLGKVSGLFGRSRKFGDEGEKARKRVSAAIRRALEAIEKENTDLWRHLNSYIITGYNCSYKPSEDIEWSF